MSQFSEVQTVESELNAVQIELLDRARKLDNVYNWKLGDIAVLWVQNGDPVGTDTSLAEIVGVSRQLVSTARRVVEKFDGYQNDFDFLWSVWKRWVAIDGFEDTLDVCLDNDPPKGDEWTPEQVFKFHHQRLNLPLPASVKDRPALQESDMERSEPIAQPEPVETSGKYDPAGVVDSAADARQESDYQPFRADAASGEKLPEDDQPLHPDHMKRPPKEEQKPTRDIHPAMDSPVNTLVELDVVCRSVEKWNTSDVVAVADASIAALKKRDDFDLKSWLERQQGS